MHWTSGCSRRLLGRRVAGDADANGLSLEGGARGELGLLAGCMAGWEAVISFCEVECRFDSFFLRPENMAWYGRSISCRSGLYELLSCS